MNHWMKIRHQFFEKVTRGEKCLEVRLYDAKRRQFNQGDIITFTDEISGLSHDVTIKDLYIYPDFQSLFRRFAPEEFGFPAGTPIDEMISYMHTIYQPWDEIRFGVVAIRLCSEISEDMSL